MKTMILSLIALGWGYWNHRRATDLEARLENVRNSHFRLADRSRDMIDQLQEQVGLLKNQLRALKSGDQLYQPNMTLDDALKLDSRVADVLGGFHIGGCSSCAVSPTDTLAQAAISNGQNVELVLQALNKLNTNQGDQVIKMLERTPNVQLSL
ncbi:MAG: hypothetical protein ACPGWR_20930 [Ardenticatenaceae bacterium]